MHNTIFYLYHNLLAAFVAHTPMYGIIGTWTGLYRYYPYVVDGLFHLVDRRKLRQYPCHKLQVGKRNIVVGRIIIDITAIMRVIKQSR